ncbi:hypothetical protein [Moraxella marmotae]|uniref:hypothetical protein n=1 Tax=Moraxella marmotae TaxID=3344520 RepID=UPI0035F4BACC
MNPLTQLKQMFEQDTKGYIYMRQLEQVSRSKMLIRDIARQYGYYPVYARRGHIPLAYQHHTLPNDHLTSQ